MRLFNENGLGNGSAQGMHLNYLIDKAMEGVFEYAKTEDIDIRDVEAFCAGRLHSTVARHIVKESGILNNTK